MTKTALISGITGQDGSYLAEFLLGKGYEVHGMMRRVASQDQSARLERIPAGVVKAIHTVPCDISNFASVYAAVAQIKPDEFYHLAAQSDVGLSFKDPHQTMGVNVLGTLNVLEALRLSSPATRFYFAGSSEMFGKVVETPQTEKTPFHPRSPYGVSKVAGFDLTRNYREREDSNMFCCSGILFNHESPRRGTEFVTRKITEAIRRKQFPITLGNLDAKRDWGFSGDYVEAMWLMLQQDKPDDYVIATNESHSVREFLDEAFRQSGVLDWTDKVKTNDSFLRPSEVNLLKGDYSKAKRVLGWEPRTKFKDLIALMLSG